jgi:hypothetical protein
LANARALWCNNALSLCSVAVSYSLALLVFLTFCVFPGLHLCFLAKTITKTIEHLKYKIDQKARRNRPKEQSNIIYSSTCKNSIKINLLGIRRICLCFEKKKSVQNSREKTWKRYRNTKNIEKGNENWT